MRRTRFTPLLAAVGAAAVMSTSAMPANGIVGGGLASTGEYPWMAAVYTVDPELLFCGGTLVKPTIVITAAHCILGLPAPGVTGVMLGRNTLNGTGGEEIPVAGFVIHPAFNAANNTFDIAAVRLVRPALATPISGWVVPGQESLYAAGVTATVTGWGLTKEDGDISNALKEATVPIVSDAQCADWYGGPPLGITNSQHVCAGYENGGTDTCQGDSGGPLMVRNASNQFVLAGITSWGDGCARPERPGVYSEVATLSSFISLMTTGA